MAVALRLFMTSHDFICKSTICRRSFHKNYLYWWLPKSLTVKFHKSPLRRWRHWLASESFISPPRSVARSERPPGSGEDLHTTSRMMVALWVLQHWGILMSGKFILVYPCKRWRIREYRDIQTCRHTHTISINVFKNKNHEKNYFFSLTYHSPLPEKNMYTPYHRYEYIYIYINTNISIVQLRQLDSQIYDF